MARQFTDKTVVAFGVLCLVIVLVIVAFPFTAVESTVQVVCVASPCEDMVVLEN